MLTVKRGSTSSIASDGQNCDSHAMQRTSRVGANLLMTNFMQLGDCQLNPVEGILESPIAVTLIVCGTLLILFPVTFDFLHQQQVMSTLQSRPDFRDVSCGRRMSDVYTVACVAIGAAMIGVSIVLSLRSPLFRPLDRDSRNGN
jgi:hypothetical protein